MAILGVDIGTQSLKVVVTRDGAVLGEASQSYALLQPQPGWAEQDPRLWERALGAVIPNALKCAGLAAADIGCVAIAGQLDGCIAVDAQGQPVSNCLVWMDRRAEEHVPALSGALLAKTGLVFDASHLGAKIAWLRANGAPCDARFHQPTSYIVERLCGAYVCDHALASTSMLYDLGTRDYCDELLAAFGVERGAVPAIANTEDIAGRVSKEGAALSGLAPGTPLAVGTGDDFATILGAGITGPGPLLVGLGTAEVVGTLSTDLRIDAEALVETHGFLGGYFVQNPGWQSGGAVAWVRTILSVASDAELDALAAQAPAGCDGLVFLPALSGAMAPRWRAGARGCFYGLSSHHGRAHMARAVLEGCAFAMRDVRDRLQEMGLAGERVVLQGGGARSAFWAQVRADLCQVEVSRQIQTNGSALGASYIAEAAIDASKKLAELSASRRPTSIEHEPNPTNASTYEDAYRRYRLLFDSLEPLFESP